MKDKGTGMRIPQGDKKAFGSRARLHSSDSVEGLVSTVLLQETELSYSSSETLKHILPDAPLVLHATPPTHPHWHVDMFPQMSQADRNISLLQQMSL